VGRTVIVCAFLVASATQIHAGAGQQHREEDVSFQSGATTLAGTLSLPPGAGPFPAVVLLSGSGPQNRDSEVMGFRPFKLIADHFVARGIAVLRFDDRGVGRSTGSVAGATIEDFAGDALAAARTLRARHDIDGRRIGLVGHSEGAIVAAAPAARTPDVAFIVWLAGHAVSGAEILRMQAEGIARDAGASPSAIDEILRHHGAMIAAVKENASVETLTSLSPDDERLAAILRDDHHVRRRLLRHAWVRRVHDPARCESTTEVRDIHPHRKSCRAWSTCVAGRPEFVLAQLTHGSWRPAGEMTRTSSHLLACLAAGAAVCVLSGTAVSTQDPQDERLTLFGRYLDGLRRQVGIPGLSAVIVQDGRIVWERGFGFQDVERRIPAGADTPYRIASLTKTFSATLLLACVERGALDLDESIKGYTGGIPEAEATVRHVLAHQSAGVPGREFRYDGNRFGALTTVVESCWTSPFRRVLADEILDRLSMQDSVPGHDLDSPDLSTADLFDERTLARYRRVLSRIAQPYRVNSRGRSTLATFPPRGINAAAGLVSTARDLAKYDRALDDHVLLRLETQELAWTPSRTTLGQSTPYGLGWFVQTVDGERIVWHYGQWDASYSSLLLKVPARRIALILLANSDGLSAPFPMAAGDVRVSPFAAAFLRIVR
jgi:CubicO group peptidase (beta-lactamase class C family)/pimeloyl-ACP methyl ester carboxylesterase